MTALHATPLDDHGSSEISFVNSGSDQARAVRVRTLPCAPSAIENFATFSPSGEFDDGEEISVTGREEDLLDLDPTFFASW